MTSHPKAVQIIQASLAATNVWHIVAKNQGLARSCREAANVRRRLGAFGIPLWDELKSHVGRFNDERGERQYVIVHCRAHQARDDGEIDRIVGAHVERVDADELRSTFELEYGRVNPFSFITLPNVRQIFDPQVLANYGAPHSMMTNAGDLEWAVEFRPTELVEMLPNSTVANCTTPSTSVPLKEPVLGILTGNGPESGMELWKRINARVKLTPKQLAKGDIDYPQVRVASLPGMGMSMELSQREDDVHDVVLAGIDALCAAGSTVIGVACNTTEYYYSDIRERCLEQGAKFISIVDCCADELRRCRAERLDLLGIGSVTDLSRWSGFRRLANDFEVVTPSAQAIRQIDDLAWEVKAKSDRTSGGAVAKLLQTIISATSTPTILIALTELSIVLAEHPRVAQRVVRETGKLIIDSLTLLANAMADAYTTPRLELIARATQD